ncbi:MAG: aldehyde dehydrogenase [Acidimicrobiaceae bacterium]|nr:aldehyde dehydrogenase [Acidimicrobiaceae bacterium]|tara:strand:+ start:1564 stop:3036 length:1473 start_codon:yes stop_codon:yes gene_type:complete
MGDVRAIDPQEEWSLLIGGEWVGTASNYDVVDPNTTQIVGHAPDATVADAEAAIASAKAALPAWAATSPVERGALLQRLADVLRDKAPAWSALVQAETGATINVAETMQVGPNLADRYAQYAIPRNLDRAEMPVAQAASALGPAGLVGAAVYRRPVGVVACITSYNFPLVNVAGKLAPALAMGNTCIIKPAPQDPLGVLLLGRAVEEAGFPPGVVNILTSAGTEVPAALVRSPDVNMVSFTGSSAVGARIMADGAPSMTRTLMELGGKGALVMTDDADVGKAVGAIASVWGFHSGQICTAPTRVICHRSKVDELVGSLTAVAGMLKVGNATERDTLVGPLVSEQQRDSVEAFIRGGVEAGATLVCGGERPDLPGYFVVPTLLADCTAEMHVVREEAFGPVIVVLAHDDDDEAVALANDSEYGLFSYVYSADNARALWIAQQIQSGNVALNSVVPHPEAPFGGFKRSGIGRDRGVAGLEAYTEVQAISWQA